MREHAGLRLHVCQYCNRSFNRLRKLNEHMDNHVYETCPICNKTLGKKGYKFHAMIHTNTYGSICEKCGKKFRTKTRCDRHTLTCKTDNPPAQPFICPACDRNYYKLGALQNHINKKHADQAEELKLQIKSLIEDSVGVENS